MKAVERAGEIAKTKRMRQSLLKNYLREPMQEECQSPGAYSDDIRSMKSEMETTDKDRFQGALIRGRAQKLLLAENQRRGLLVKIISVKSNLTLIRSAMMQKSKQLFMNFAKSLL